MKTGELDRIGQEYLEKADYKQAIRYFQRALKQEDHPAIRNNLALAHYMAGNPEKSLDALRPNINPDAPPNPFSHSLATQIFHQLGQAYEAGQQLDFAIKDFEDGVRAFPDSRYIPDFWGEYTLAIFRAAGALSEHRQVYELHRRWQNYHRHWESSYLAGVAAFNLKRYRQAANCWARLLQQGRIYTGIQRLALAVEQGHIPHFTLDYRLVNQEHILSLAKQAINSGAAEHFRQLANDSTVRLFYLALAIDEEAPLDERSQFIRLLVRYGEKWGEQLGRNLLLSPTIHQDLKIQIMAALQEAGFIKAGESLQMYADGEIRTVVYEQYDVSGGGSTEEAAFDQAVTLVKKGQLKEAMQILEPPFTAGKFYVPAMLLLAHLNHQIGAMQKTEKILYVLQGIADQTRDEKLMLNLVSFYLNIGDAFMARRQLEQIDDSQIPQELKQQIQKRLSELEVERLLQHQMDHFKDDMRHAIEDKSLSINPPLQRGLKNMPVEWINAACETYDLQPARRRTEREKQLILHLQEKEVLQYIVDNIEEDERKLLQYLLAHEGWSQTGPITRKFGSMEGDGFYWNADDGPYSPLGHLWSMGLVFVGKAIVNNRSTKIATIPMELRPLLAGML